jgi:hypothetical protein
MSRVEQSKWVAVNFSVRVVFSGQPPANTPLIKFMGFRTIVVRLSFRRGEAIPRSDELSFSFNYRYSI